MSNISDKIFYRGEYACPWWFCFTFDNPIRALYQNPIKIVSKYIKPGDIILDIGPGQGYFTFPISQIITSTGKIYALDIQTKMLEILKSRAIKKGYKNIITTLYDGISFGIQEKFDFILLFWMFHEVKNKENFLKEVIKVCTGESKILLVEPKIHVTKKQFEITISLFKNNGFMLIEEVKAGLSRGALFGI